MAGEVNTMTLSMSLNILKNNCPLGVTHVFLSGVTMRISLGVQDSNHICSDCEDLLLNNGINSDTNNIANNSYYKLSIQLEGKEHNFEILMQHYKYFNLITKIVNYNNYTVFSKGRSCLITAENKHKLGFCHFIPKSGLDLITGQNNHSLLCIIENLSQTSPSIKKIKYFQSLLLNETLSDVTLNIKTDLKIPAHKSVLYAMSPYFEKMFSHENKENTSNEVEVNFESEPFLEVLKYIYTQEVEKLNTLGIEIYKIANYYQIQDLKLICEEYLKKNLKKNKNVIEVLKLSVDYEALSLQNYCIDFLLKNFSTAEIDSDDLSELFVSTPKLGFKLFLSLFQKK